MAEIGIEMGVGGGLVSRAQVPVAAGAAVSDLEKRLADLRKSDL